MNKCTIGRARLAVCYATTDAPDAPRHCLTLAADTLAVMGPTGPPYDDAVLSPDGRWSAAPSIGSGGIGYLWAYPRLNDLWRFAAANAIGETAVAFSPDSRWLATTGDAGVAVWSLPRYPSPP